jgi:glycosyltransferase involved in cell wall biosynthesis
MRVGIYAGRQSGGGFTFETEILGALSKIADQSHHEFILLSPSEEDYINLRPYVDSPLITAATLTKAGNPVSHRKRFLKKISTAISKRLKNPGGAGGKLTVEPVDTIEKMARANGVQVIWFAGQSYEFIPDTPYLATLWDLQHRLQPFFPEVQEGGEWERREAGLSRYLRRAAVVIAGSQTAGSEINSFYQVPVERIRVLPHPTPEFSLDPPPINDGEILKKYGISGDYLFYPAQFWAHKNHINLLLALGLLRKRHGVSLNMVFIGSNRGNEAYVRQKVEEFDLASQVKILGFVPQSDIIALYRRAFALTYMTFFGPDNLPPLEAFALGCPVIASNVSGAQEQLGNAAILVDPQKPEEMTQAIWKLWKSPKLRVHLIRMGKKRSLDWTSSDFVRGVFEILDEFESVRRTWP